MAGMEEGTHSSQSASLFSFFSFLLPLDLLFLQVGRRVRHDAGGVTPANSWNTTLKCASGMAIL